MQIVDNYITPHCGQQPTLDTWDKNEMRSIKCFRCGLKTKSYFFRQLAYEELEAVGGVYIKEVTV